MWLISWIYFSRKTGIRITNQLIRLFHHHHFKRLLFREMLRNISQSRKVASENRRNTFITNWFEEKNFNTGFNDGTTVLTTMYMTDYAQVLKVQVSISSESNDFLFQPIVKSLWTDGAVFQTDPM